MVFETDKNESFAHCFQIRKYKLYKIWTNPVVDKKEI